MHVNRVLILTETPYLTIAVLVIVWGRRVFLRSYSSVCNGLISIWWRLAFRKTVLSSSYWWQSFDLVAARLCRHAIILRSISNDKRACVLLGRGLLRRLALTTCLSVDSIWLAKSLLLVTYTLMPWRIFPERWRLIPASHRIHPTGLMSL